MCTCLASDAATACTAGEHCRCFQIPHSLDGWKGFQEQKEDMPQIEAAPPTHAPTPAPAPLLPEFDDSLDPGLEPTIKNLRTSLEFCCALEAALLDNGDLSVEDVHRLRHPVEKIIEIDNPNVLLLLRLFVSTTSASDKVYNNIQEDILE
ncbi:hypothetical protein B0H34DRAFT_675119 [Crassisporium funariophilum]|nr:hypothetical protein B0H34DRAFT_675119 [Crassisporium funariophilum]